MMRTKSFAFSRVFLFAAAIFLGVLVTSCEREPLQSLPGHGEWAIANKSLLAAIQAGTADYEVSIVQAINERNAALKAGGTAGIGDRINQIFGEKFGQRMAGMDQLKSADASFSMAMDSAKLQRNLDRLAERLTAHIDSYGQESDITKESFLINQQAVVNSFSNEVYNDPSLSAHEKQVVLATVLLNANIIALTIEYGEEIAGATNQMKRSCNWWCRAEKALLCSGLTAAAGVACATAATPPQWVACAALAVVAVTCWAN